MIAQMIVMAVILIFTKEYEWNIVDDGEYWQSKW